MFSLSKKCGLLVGLVLGVLFSFPVHAGLDQANALFDREDYPQSLADYKELAAHGNGEAAYWVGHQYLKGLGVKTDPKQEVQWFKHAIIAGHEPAKKALEALKKSLADPENKRRL